MITSAYVANTEAIKQNLCVELSTRPVLSHRLVFAANSVQGNPTG